MDSTPASLFDKLRGPGRVTAWNRFVHLYTPLLLRWADRLGVPAGDRDDLVQDVFVSVFQALPAFAYDPARGFRRWLYTVAANRWRDHVRKKAAVALPGSDSHWADSGADPAELVSEAEYRAVLAVRAAHLIREEFSEPTWRAFWATAVEDRPAAAVAADLGLTPNAVYLARARVLARLRAELAGLVD